MRDILKTIAARHWLATDEQIIELARANRDSAIRVNDSGSTYLRVLVAMTQEALGHPVRMKPVRGRVADGDLDRDLGALAEVNKRLYALVLKAVTTPDVADRPGLRKAESQRRALERNRRSNFARTAKSSLFRFIKAGGNVACVVVPTVTKHGLDAETKKRRQPASVTAEQSANRIVRSVLHRLEAQREEDPAIAQQAAQQLLLQLTEFAGCDKYTSSPKKATEQGILLRINEGTFLPMPQPSSTEGGEPATQH